MIDSVRIYVKAGKGGSGCNSFKGIKFTKSRHPDGGSGGRGADLIIRVDGNIQDLKQFQSKQHFRAEDGKDGSANKKRGADGRPCIIKVPPGTIVRDLKDNLLLRDLVEADEELMVAQGGAGGKGNTKTKAATEGSPGEERHLLLELRIVADVGIIGYPNVGKSTLLDKISSAHAKVGSYPFTTTTPVLGNLEFTDFEEPSNLTVIEIPALIKGAHRGKGLGTKFLRHAERTEVLIHLIDMAAQEKRDPLEDYQDVNAELALYSKDLSDKPQILVANKMDLTGAETNLRRFSSRVGETVYPVSALSGTGIKELIDNIRGYFI